ncbi:glycoside hydrolase N-terminal domain-containing protein [Streptomyces sp. 7-21]|uniref:glycoside hydrolase family 95 protein n=1 Tax=Streptomyces sp. 7-21 TaxID=2802283 RepID=UPI00191DA4B8|nr:glycoside hydrolase family 95 protein [Streptomyces sp. 7-21]
MTDTGLPRRAFVASVTGAAAALGTAAPASAASPAPAAAGRPSPSPGTPGMTLWYESPATDWESQALPLGNGAMGVCFFGDPARERLQFNEKTLWTGGPGAAGYDFGNWRSPRPGALDEVRARINEEQRASPEWVAERLGQPRTAYGAYQPFGDVWVECPAGPGGVTGYRRYLDIAEAVGGVRYAAGGVTYAREYLASAPAGVIAARFTADQPGAVSVTVSVTTGANRTATLAASGGRITLAGVLDSNGLRFASQVLVCNEGGTRTDNPGGSVTVSGADAVTLLLAAATDYAPRYPRYRSGTDPHGPVTARVDAAAARGFAALRREHRADYQELFGRVRLRLGEAADPGLPTDALLAAYQDGTLDEAGRRSLETLYFQYGRYLLISSSRPGSLPANLQGVWNHSAEPPWSADYHVNINLQMNYWPAETTNLTETTAPLFDYADSLMAPGQVTAREMFGSRGWVVHNETTPFGFTGVHDWPTAFWFPEAGAWLAQHYYEHYLFTGDETFLRERAYPVMKSLSRFWADTLVTDPRDGTLVVSPSFSPEHGEFSAGASMSQQIVWELLTATAAVAQAAGEQDQEFLAQLRGTLDRLDPGLRIGSWGQLQEWKEDWDDPGSDHRHVSHLFALHPGRRITPQRDPELARAARVSLTARGDGGTGWSKAWKISFWARLLDGDRAHSLLAGQLRSSTLPNLWDTHPPFQIDGNFGATAGIAEMLVQSHADAIHLLPALPGAWPHGSVTGLRARGDVTVSLRWRDGQVVRAALRAGRTGEMTVRSGVFRRRYRIRDARGGRPAGAARDGDTLTFRARRGHTYVLTAG